MVCFQHVSKITVFSLLILSLQFPLLLSLFFAPSVSSVNANDAFQNFKDIDFSNITSLDIIARKAMKYLHDDLDHDDDGNVSLTEGAQFIDREEFESLNSNLPGFATDKDGRITETEFWETWVTSEVHNWTVLQMIEWLSFDVDLPQYADNFKQYGIMGAAMPILARNSSLVLSLVDGCKEHRLKLWLKAMEVVLFGYSSSRSNLAKDILLTVSILLALSGMAYAFHVRRSAGLAVATMQEKLIILQKEMTKLDEDYPWSKEPSSDDLIGESLSSREVSSSHSSLTSENNLQTRLNEVMDELSDAKIMLEQAEERLNDQKWLPPDRLLSCLKTTYKVELKLHEAKRLQVQKKVEQAKSQFLKMKKKTSIFTSVQLVHSHQVDNFDLEVQVAKDLLCEVQRESQEFKKRWVELECLCKCKFLASSGFRSKPITKQYSKDSPSMSLKMKNSSVFGSNGTLYSRRDPDNDSLGGLQMKELTSNSSNSKNHISTQQSCPSLSQSRSNENNALPNSQSTETRQRTISHRRNNTGSFGEKDRFSDRFRTVPRKSTSPLLSRQKTLEPVQTSSEPDSNFVGDQKHKRKPSLDSSEVKSLTGEQKSLSSRSLPDLIDNKTKLIDSKSPPVRASTMVQDSEKSNVKKRSFFGGRFKKIMKS